MNNLSLRDYRLITIEVMYQSGHELFGHPTRFISMSVG